MQPFIPITITVIFIIFFNVALKLSIKDYATPLKRIVDKYGIPLNHFATHRGLNTLPIRGSRIDLDFFSDFLVITIQKSREIILKKDFKDYKIYDSFFKIYDPFLKFPIFEKIFNTRYILEIDDIQICLSNKQRVILEKFFEN